VDCGSFRVGHRRLSPCLPVASLPPVPSAFPTLRFSEIARCLNAQMEGYKLRRLSPLSGLNTGLSGQVMGLCGVASTSDSAESTFVSDNGRPAARSTRTASQQQSELFIFISSVCIKVHSQSETGHKQVLLLSSWSQTTRHR